MKAFRKKWEEIMVNEKYRTRDKAKKMDKHMKGIATDGKAQVYNLSICGRIIKYRFNDLETSLCFGKYIRPSESDYHDIAVSYEFMNDNRRLVQETATDAFLEFQAIMIATGNYLLQYRCALFHGVSFIWRGLAWILTARSGTGKTTQLINWMKRYGTETQVINGDKTGLECRDDKTVYVYSSPWRGKERFGFRDRCAKLGGILLLEQGEENRSVRLEPGEAVRPLFKEFISFPETEEQILNQRDILERMLDAVPVWKFVNLGDEASTVVLRQTLEKCMQTDVSGFSDNKESRVEDGV